jgi:hypothetical protein
VATAKRNGRQCIAVILGATDSGYAWAASLLDKCWAKPSVATTGVRLPPVAVSPYGTRIAARAAFTKIAVGSTGAALAKAAPTTATTAAPTTSTRSAATPTAGHPKGPTPHTAGVIATRTPLVTSTIAAKKPVHHSGGLLSPVRVAFLLVILLVVAVGLRRRAVKRQRARRIARQRARAKAMRSGSLPVVDGRYRTGMRVGPPLESRVRVKRTHIDLTEDEPSRDPDRGSRTDFFGLN